MSSSESTDSPQLKVMHAMIEGVKKRDVEHVGNQLHKDHRRITYPRSLGKPEQTKEEYLQHLGEVMKLWTDDSEPVVHSIVEAPGKVVIHYTNKAKTSIGVEMVREMVFIAHFAPDEDGSLKIKKFEEFTDSKAYLDFFKAVAQAEAHKAA